MIEIDGRSPVPSYEQIHLQIRSAITTGQLQLGAPLPPIRQLAKDLELNPATIAKAYQILEMDGIIETAGRRGTFVHANAKANLKENLRKTANDQVLELLGYWHKRGMSYQDLKEIFNRNLQVLKPV